MFSLSLASRVAAELVAPRLAAAASAMKAAAVAPFSTLLSGSNWQAPAAAAASAPLLSLPSALALPHHWMLPALSRGLATRTGGAASARKTSTSKKAGGAASKSKQTGGRGARNAKKKTKAPSAAVQRAKAVASQRRAKKAAAVKNARDARAKQRAVNAARRQQRAKRAAKEREAKRQSAAKRRQARQARERELSKQRAEQRKRMQARRAESKQRQHQQAVERRRRARSLAAARRQRAEIVAQATRAVARAKAFRGRHPTVAKRRDLESATGLTAPRRPAPVLSAYLKANFARVKAELAAQRPAGSKVSGPDVVREVAAQYKRIPAEEKEAAERAYKERVAQYQKELERFHSALPPKRPPTAYLSYFVRVQGEVARANPGLSASDVVKKIAEQWRSLGASEKSSLSAASEREVSAWKDRLAEWHDAHPDASLHRPSNSVAAVTKALKEKKGLAANKGANASGKTTTPAIKKAPRKAKKTATDTK